MHSAYAVTAVPEGDYPLRRVVPSRGRLGKMESQSGFSILSGGFNPDWPVDRPYRPFGRIFHAKDGISGLGLGESNIP